MSAPPQGVEEAALATSTGWLGWSTGDAADVAGGVVANAGRDGDGALPQAATSVHAANRSRERLITDICRQPLRARTAGTMAWFPGATMASTIVERPFHLL
jgi:hypothetical protein